MKVNAADLQKLLNAQYFGSASDFELQDVSIDSRSLKNTEGVLFFAIQGTFHDAHQFIPELIDRGVRQFVVQYIPEKVKEQAQFRSEEHTSQLQSRPHLVCRLLLEKKKKKTL